MDPIEKKLKTDKCLWIRTSVTSLGLFWTLHCATVQKVSHAIIFYSFLFYSIIYHIISYHITLNCYISNVLAVSPNLRKQNNPVSPFSRKIKSSRKKCRTICCLMWTDMPMQNSQMKESEKHGKTNIPLLSTQGPIFKFLPILKHNFFICPL